MYLVIGRGRSRKVYEIPCADIVKRAGRDDVKQLVENVCAILNVK